MAYAKESEADMTPATSEESVAVPEPSTGGASSRHPPYNAMVKRAITTLKVKNGASSKAISSFICSHYGVKKAPCKSAVERSLKRMVRGGLVSRNKRNLYKLTGKGRKLKGKKRRRRRKASKKAGRRRRRRRGRKAGKKSKKSKKGKKKRKKASKKSRKSRRGRKRRRTTKRRTRRVTKRRTRKRGKRARKAGKRRRR